MNEEKEEGKDEEEEPVEEPVEKEEELGVTVPEEYEELGRKEKVLRMLEDKQYDIADVLRTIRMTIRQDAIPDKSLIQRLQEAVDVLKKYREIY